MQILPIRTRKLLPPQDDLFSVLDDSLPELKDGDVLFVTSKIASIHQGYCVPMSEIDSKNKLIQQEADAVLTGTETSELPIGIINNTVNPFAGVDESNGNGYYILPPQDPNKFAAELRSYLTTWRGHVVDTIGVVIVDSVFLPMRAGSVSVSLGFAGIEPLRSYTESLDIFGRELQMSNTNIVDSLSAMAGIYFGEGNEQTPLVLMRNVEGIEFTNKNKSGELTNLPHGDVFEKFLKMFK